MSIHSEFFDAQHFQHHYSFRLPPPALAKDVEYFWQSDFRLEADKTKVGERVFANLSTSLVFNLGTPFYYNDKDNTRYEIDQHVIIGARTLPAVFEHQQQNQLFGVKFRPAGLLRFFRISPSNLKNEIVELRSVLKSRLLADQLRKLDSFGERILLFNKFLSGKSPKNNQTTHQAALVEQTIQLYKQEYIQNPKLYKYAQRLFVSPKSLTRYFQNVLGMNPKTCLNILRLRDALRHFTDPQSDFSVYDFGYTDYSHFIKEVRKYTETIPSLLR